MERIFKNLRQIIDDFQSLEGIDKAIVWEIINNWVEDFSRKDGWGDFIFDYEDLEDYKEEIENINKKYNLPTQKSIRDDIIFIWQEDEDDEPNDENTTVIED